MRVREPAAVERLRGLGLLQLVGLLDLDLGVEERPHDLLADLGVQLLEHPCPSEVYSTSGSFCAIARRCTPSRR